jgi:hypothetical protein
MATSVRAPITDRHRLVHPLLQEADKAVPGQGSHPEARQVGSRDLAVEQLEAPADQLLDQSGHGHFRCVAGEAEHRFAEEHATERHAVDATDQGRPLPGLDRMCVPEFVQQLVGVTHGRRDPGALGSQRPVAAMRNDRSKRAVDRDCVTAIAHAASQAARNMKLARSKHCPRIG